MIPAAGMGLRLGASGPKALVSLAGAPMLVRTLERFAPLGLIDNAVIVIPSEYREDFQSALEAAFPGVCFNLAGGGAERQLSVENGLAMIEPSTDVVAIHDAARPFISMDSVREALDAAARWGAATVAVPSIDTILVSDAEGFLCDTPDRRMLWACQTPQVFRVEVIRAAHAQARRDGFAGTDDASLVRRCGGRVKLVRGTPMNFKVTTPGDLDMARCLFQAGLVKP